MYPLALEGALKLKEITYKHCEGYAAGELKHGPLALIDKDIVVIALAPYNDNFSKLLSNIQEIKAREGKVILITDKLGAKKAQKYCTCVVNILSKKYSDSEIDKIFKKTKNEVIKTTEFASKYCEANKG